jgi:hypothetical protein
MAMSGFDFFKPIGLSELVETLIDTVISVLGGDSSEREKLRILDFGPIYERERGGAKAQKRTVSMLSMVLGLDLYCGIRAK